jgi:hypothetical protein
VCVCVCKGRLVSFCNTRMCHRFDRTEKKTEKKSKKFL